MSESYRTQFDNSNAAASYDQVQYDTHSYASTLWHIEQAQLQDLLKQFHQSHPQINYLDFACGTGRVLGALESAVQHARGIEVSPFMAQRARATVKHAKVDCVDITDPSCQIEDHYDLITAFRFVLNAEPALRLAGLKALRARLKDDSSWLIFNNHGNPFSHKGMLWPYHQLRRPTAGHRNAGNYLTNRAVVKLAHEAGLRIERTLGAGLVGGKLARFVPGSLLERTERTAAASRTLRPILVNQMYVARRRE